MHHFSDIAAPLNNFTVKGAPFIWSQECVDAFTKLTHAPVLANPQFDHQASEFSLQTDASAVGIRCSTQTGWPCDCLCQSVSKCPRRPIQRYTKRMPCCGVCAKAVLPPDYYTSDIQTAQQQDTTISKPNCVLLPLLRDGSGISNPHNGTNSCVLSSKSLMEYSAGTTHPTPWPRP